MIRLFKSTETDFSHDGVEVLDDIVISSVTDWSENSKWVIEAKFKKDFDKSEQLQNGMILKVPTEKGEQLFQILKTNKKNRKFITVYGQAIGHSFNDNFIQDINIVEKSGRAAIQQISAGTVEKHRYNLSSNIDIVASARMVRKNGIDALLGDETNTFISRWGGYLVLDNFNIAMNSSVGTDKGVEISIGKNVVDYDGTIDESTVVTGINAITYDGLTLPEGVYYSPLVNNYANKKIKEFKFDSIKYKYSNNNTNEEGYETLEEVYEAIRKACDELFNVSNIDKPTCSLRVDIAALEHTDQYKGDELNERIFQGDILTANLDDYGFDVKLKMVANRYDNIRDKYIDIDLGDAKSNALSNIGKVENVIDKVIGQLGGNTWQDILDKSMQEAAQLIAEGIKDSYVICRKNEILIMDAPEVESAINVIRMNRNGIAFSQSGYNGPYTLAITIDGKINASCITTGQLNAALIKTGFLQSANNKTWINMENGTFSFADKITYDGTNVNINVDSLKIKSENVATTQDIDSFKIEVGQSGGDNEVVNSGFRTGDITNWMIHQYNNTSSNCKVEVWHDDIEWILQGKKCATIMATGDFTGGGEYGISQSLTGLKTNTDYTVSFLVAGHRCQVSMLVRNTGTWEWLAYHTGEIGIGGKDTRNWSRITKTFNTKEYNSARLEFLISYPGQDATLWVTDVMINEGIIPQPWQPSSKDLEWYTNAKFEILNDRVTSEISSTNSNVSSLEQTINGFNTNVNNRIDGVQSNLSQTASSLNSSISSVDGRVTTLNQSLDGFSQSVRSSGGSNLAINGNASDGLNGWARWETYGERFEVWDDTNVWIPNGKKAFVMYTGASGNQCGFYQWFKTIPNRTYTVSYMIAGHGGNKTALVRTKTNWQGLARKDYEAINGGKNFNDWIVDSMTFTALEDTTMIWFDANTGVNNWLWVIDVMVNEGSISKPWQNSQSEVFGSHTKLTTDSFEVSFTNGTKMLVNKDLPLTLYDGTTQRQYHALSERGKIVLGGVAGVFPKEAWVQLPAIFKGKNFRVSSSVSQTAGGSSIAEWVARIEQDIIEYDYAGGRFKIKGYWISRTDQDEIYEKELDISWIAIA